MRQRRFRLYLALALASLGVVPARAQPAGLTTEGAPFLLLPVGARAVGMGQALVADQPGTEAIWWNPAGVARSERREIAVHHYETIVGTGDAVSILIPSSLLGVFSASLYALDFGTEAVTDSLGTQIGSIVTRNVVYGATYATPIGGRINAGITFKIVQFRIDCSSGCESQSGSSSALDFGAQYDLGFLAPVSIGVAVRNMGAPLQVNDSEQADPLPARIQIGVMYRVPGVERYAPQTELHLTGDVLDRLKMESPAPRVGAALTWRQRAHLRGGYVFESTNSAESSGPSMGLGLATDNLRLDIATIFEGFSTDAGKRPTYVSLRYLF
ncbi:MAG: PorV/PorQ family protein [Gemmatimonadaceae bacterium]